MRDQGSSEATPEKETDDETEVHAVEVAETQNESLVNPETVPEFDSDAEIVY